MSPSPSFSLSRPSESCPFFSRSYKCFFCSSYIERIAYGIIQKERWFDASSGRRRPKVERGGMSRRLREATHMVASSRSSTRPRLPRARRDAHPQTWLVQGRPQAQAQNTPLNTYCYRPHGGIKCVRLNSMSSLRTLLLLSEHSFDQPSCRRLHAARTFTKHVRAIYFTLILTLLICCCQYKNRVPRYAANARKQLGSKSDPAPEYGSGLERTTKPSQNGDGATTPYSSALDR